MEAGFAHAKYLANEMREEMQASTAELLNILTRIEAHDKAMDDATADTASTMPKSTEEKANLTMQASHNQMMTMFQKT